MEICSAVAWMQWSSWAIYITFMIFAIKWMYKSYAKSPLERAVDQLSADAIYDIQEFLDSSDGETSLSKYLETRLDRLACEIENRAANLEGDR